MRVYQKERVRGFPFCDTEHRRHNGANGAYADTKSKNLRIEGNLVCTLPRAPFKSAAHGGNRLLTLLLYLSDVDEGTHCISFSPEDATEPLHKSNEEQLGARGEYHLHGPKGTVRAKPGSLSALRLHNLVAILPLTALRTLRADRALQLGHPAHGDHAADRLHAQVRPDLLRPPRQALPRERLRHPADFLERSPGPGDASVLR